MNFRLISVSILGGILLVGSLYTMLWGKSKEVKVDSNVTHDTEKAEHKKSAERYQEEQHHTTTERSRNQH